MKVVQFSVVVLVMVLTACGGGSGSSSKGGVEIAPEDAPPLESGSNFTRGLTGTLYYKRKFTQFEALDIATGEIRLLREEGPTFGKYTSSADGTLHTTTVGFRPENDVLALSEKLVVADDSGQEVHSFTFLGEAQSTAVISPDNQYIAVIVEQVRKEPIFRGLHIYSISGQLLRVIPDTSEFRFSDIAFNSNGALMVSAYQNGLYFMSNPLNDEPQLLRKTPDYTMLDPSLSPDGELLAFVNNLDRQLYVLGPESSEARQMTLGANSWIIIDGFDWSPDGKHLAVIYSLSNRGCEGNYMMIIEAGADRERLPVNIDEIKTGTSSQKIFPVDAYIPRDSGPLHSLLLCVSGDPTWR